MGYLRHFSFDKIKIDRSFVGGIEDRADARAIIEAALGLGRKLGMAAVAEGVESDAQIVRPRTIGSRQVQGFHCGRPMPASTVQAVLAEPSIGRSLKMWVGLARRGGARPWAQLVAAERAGGELAAAPAVADPAPDRSRRARHSPNARR